MSENKEAKTDVKAKSVVLCAIRAEVRAEKGKGKNTALVLKADGTAILLGATMLALKGFIAEQYAGAALGAAEIAALTGAPLVIGEKALTEFVTANKGRIKNHQEVIGRIIGDAPGGNSRGGARSNRCDDI